MTGEEMAVKLAETEAAVNRTRTGSTTSRKARRQ